MSRGKDIDGKSRQKGISPDHPSAGKHVREPVIGPSWPQERDHGGGRIITPPLEIIWAIGLAAWILYSRLAFICPYFKDPDAARLAFGVGQRLQGVSFADGSFYQLEQQVGTYVLFEALARLFRVDIAGLEHFLALVCALFMIGILALSYHLGHMIWGRRVALVSTTVLSISPMMWITGEYATSLVPALFFFMLGVWAMVLSYRLRGGRWWVAASAVLFAWSVLVRLDMLLGFLVPICYAYFVDRRGLRRAWILYAITAVILLIAWLAIFRFPLGQVFAAGPHQPDYAKSLLLNWWGMGPFLFVFAFAGFVYRFVSDRRPLPFIFFWIVGFNTFYTGHLYSARYFIPYYPPVAWLAAFSIIALYGWLVRLVKYNRPARVLIMALFALGALTMLTMSTIKDGDSGTRIAWGEYISYARNHGLTPTGAAWYYMQDFRNADGLQYAWVESGARETARELFSTESEILSGGRVPIFVGNESQVFLNYFLLANGWRYESKRGSFTTFVRVASEESASPVLMLQTAYVADEPAPDLGFLSNPGRVDVFLGRDALPRLVTQEGEIGAPTLSGVAGWHVGWSFLGLDILANRTHATSADGSIDCERELARFFHNLPLPRYHWQTEPSELRIPMPSFLPLPGGYVISHDGRLRQSADGANLERTSKLTLSFFPSVHQWLALAVNRAGLPATLKLTIDGEECEEFEWLARDLPGRGISRWDILLVPPRHLNKWLCELEIEWPSPGMVYHILWTQRNFPDSQYRDEIAQPLGLDFSDIECMR